MNILIRKKVTMASRYQPINTPKTTNSALPIERIIAVLTYITAGWVGFIWLLIGIFTKNTIRPFLKYHIFQSIFLSFTYLILSIFLKLIMNILSVIPFLNQLVMRLTWYLNMPLILDYSLINLTIFGIVFYLAFTSFQGQYSYIPWVSDIIKANVRNC